MGAMESRITSLTIVYSTVDSGTDERKHQSSASLALVRGIHRSPVNSPHKAPVTRQMFPFDDVIMNKRTLLWRLCGSHIDKKRDLPTVDDVICPQVSFRVLCKVNFSVIILVADAPNERTVLYSFDTFAVHCPSNLPQQQSAYPRFETPWYSYDVAVMFARNGLCRPHCICQQFICYLLHCVWQQFKSYLLNYFQYIFTRT